MMAFPLFKLHFMAFLVGLFELEFAMGWHRCCDFLVPLLVLPVILV